jgi:hypothetical protein
MQGMLSQQDESNPTKKTLAEWTHDISMVAYYYADAMIAESEKNNG